MAAVAPAMSAKAPPPVLRCHWMASVPELQVAATVNDAWRAGDDGEVGRLLGDRQHRRRGA